jgi:hypothetical protein
MCFKLSFGFRWLKIQKSGRGGGAVVNKIMNFWAVGHMEKSLDIRAASGFARRARFKELN